MLYGFVNSFLFLKIRCVPVCNIPPRIVMVLYLSLLLFLLFIRLIHIRNSFFGFYSCFLLFILLLFLLHSFSSAIIIVYSVDSSTAMFEFFSISSLLLLAPLRSIFCSSIRSSIPPDFPHFSHCPIALSHRTFMNLCRHFPSPIYLRLIIFISLDSAHLSS